jgi:ABC-type methionine transport system permease subunit
MAAMNLVGGGGLGIFAVPEGKYMKRLGLLFFVLSILIFLVPTQF